MPPKKKQDKSQTLPPKEAALFKQVVQFYERKQYKKGIKAADSILKKHPEHGETLAMKGLTINCLGDDKKEEAYELVKKGIKFNMMSHVCWHVYGLLYRSDRNYTAAIKSYSQALRMDKDNLQILRDLALLQIHMRDLRGGIKTRQQAPAGAAVSAAGRHTLLTLKPTQRANWMGYAMANHMLRRFQTAIKVLESYENIGDESDGPYEISELILYKATILSEAGELAAAYDTLKKSEDKIRDKLAADELAAELLLQLERYPEAAEAYRGMIDRNVDNLNYHEGLRKAIDGGGSGESRLEVYTALRTKFPKSNAPLRICLDFTCGEAFKSHADIYIRKFLRRGIQSLFSDLKPLYKDEAKVGLLSALYAELLASLEADGKFPASETEPEPPQEGPMVIMWLLLLLANHYDVVGEPIKALECVNRGIEHTPTCIELQLCKARVLKHHGDMAQAVEVIDKARGMDLADRYLNTRCTVYMLRADQAERAEKVVVLFTKEELTGGTNLYDMQCMWWETESGRSYIRQGRWAEALKKLTAVEKHFEDIHEDQFDFHSYCLRKMTLRSYMAMLRTQDKVRTNKFFLRAAQSVVEICLHLHEHPPATEVEESMEGLTLQEKKKLLKKKAKEEKRKAEALEKAKQEAAKNKRRGPIDEDPNGDQLLKDTMEQGPLKLASKYVLLLQQAWPGKVVTHVLAYKLYRTLNKPLLCAQAVLRGSALDPADPELHGCLVDFCELELAEDTVPMVAEVVAEVKQEILAGPGSLASLVTTYREEHGCSSAAHKMAAVASWLRMDAAAQDSAVQFLADPQFLNEKVGWADAIKMHQQLQGLVGGEDARTTAFHKASAAKFPLSTYFNPAEPGAASEA